MTAEEYKELRKALGTQAHVARILDVARDTVGRRESGEWPIRREAALALRFLWELKVLEGGEV
jgi:DNA-binding XRE family transcriptional regulator